MKYFIPEVLTQYKKVLRMQRQFNESQQVPTVFLNRYEVFSLQGDEFVFLERAEFQNYYQ